MKNKQYIIVDKYKITDEYKKEHNLLYSNRVKLYWYSNQKITDIGITDREANQINIGDIYYL